MSMDVDVEFVSGGKAWSKVYAKVDQVIEGPYALRLSVKKYPALGDGPYGAEMLHVVSIPYTSMLCWREVNVDGD